MGSTEENPMSIITISRTIHASPNAVWDAFADFSAIYKFHPLLESSPLLSENRSGVGCERRCEFHDGNHLLERVIEWEAGSSMKVEITGGSMPLARAVVDVVITPVARDRTEVTFAMDYTPKMGLVGKVMDALMMRRQLRGAFGQILEGLETHLKTGATVGPDGSPLAVATA